MMIVCVLVLAAACVAEHLSPGHHGNTVREAVGMIPQIVNESPVEAEPGRGTDRAVVGRSVTVHPPTATCGTALLPARRRSVARRRHGAADDTTYELLVKLRRQTQSYQGNTTRRERHVPHVLYCTTKACPGRTRPIRRVVHPVTSHKVRVGGPRCSGTRKPAGRFLLPPFKRRTADSARSCALDLGPVTLPEVFTLSFWARPAESQSSGTVLETGPLQIAVVTLRAHNRTVTEIHVTLGGHVSKYKAQSWAATGWNHIAVQADLRTPGLSLHLALNGRPMDDVLVTNVPHPTRPTLSLTTATFYVGTRHRSGLGSRHGTFEGEVDKVELHAAILTEREVYQLYSGRFEPLPGPFNDCLCPEKYPFINRRDGGASCCASSTCEDNGDGTRIIRATSGLPPRSVLVGPEAVIDGVIGPYLWISTPGVANVSLDIDLGRQTEVSGVHVVLHSAPPEVGLVLSFKHGSDWLPWHYFSYNCSAFTPSRVHSHGRLPTCEHIEKLHARNAVWILKWRGLSGMWSPLVPLTDNIRVALLGFPGHVTKGHNRRLMYHVVSEVQVTERRTSTQRKPSPPVYSVSKDVQSPDRKSPGLHHRMKRQAGQPEVDNIYPPFGPISGDSIRVSGQNFGSNMSVSFKSPGGQDLKCDCTETISKSFDEGCNNDKFIGCLLNIPTNLGIQIGEPLNVSVSSADGTHVPINGNDTYTVRENPTVQDVIPRKTFISGGVKVRVIGEHLTSVAAPMMILTVTYPSRDKVYRSPVQGPACTVQNSTEMFCVTPGIPLPALYTNFQSRRKRSYDPALGDTISDARRENTAELVVQRTRVKRQEDLERVRSFYLNDDIMEVDIGFVLGGSTVPNTTQALKDIMLVARDPFVALFPKDIYEFRRYSPYNEEVLEISGKHLDLAASIEDYNATVGDEPCEITRLITNTLTCRPPAEKPTQGKFTKNGNPRVLVTVGNLRFAPGYVDYQFTKPLNLPLIIGVVVGVVVLVAIIIIIICCYRYISRMPKPDPLDDDRDYSSLLTQEKSTVMDLLDEELKLKIADCTIPPECLSRHKEIGKGNFGKVFLGKLSTKHEGVHRDESVAVKTIRDQGVTLRQVAEFLEEATIMKDFDHPNVLSLLGVVIENNRPYVLLPYMVNGDLKSYVSKPSKEFLVVDLLALAAQVTDGMAYLAKHKFVHRDLRSVNCMVDASITVKVGDFGLARDMYQGDYYKVQDQQRPLPVKWMAPESLSGGVFSSRSDVWSFAVLLWEVMTRGLRPYASIDNFKMRQYLIRGHRLEKPDFCPEKVYAMMLKCWSVEARQRPTFEEIGKQLRLVIDDTSAPNYNEVARKSDEDYIEVKRPPTVLNEYVKRPSSRIPEYLALVEGPVPDQADYLEPTAGPPAMTTEATEGVPAKHEYENDRSSGYLPPVKAGEDVADDADTDTPLIPTEQAPGAPTEAAPAEPRYENTGDSPPADLPTEQAPGAPSKPTEPPYGNSRPRPDTEREQNPYFVNPPVSDDYLSPEGKKKLEQSSSQPRGFLVGNYNPDYENTENKTGDEKRESAQSSGSGIAARAAMFGGAVTNKPGQGSRSPDYANQPGVQLRKKNRPPEAKASPPQTVPVPGVPHRGNETDGYVTTS